MNLFVHLCAPTSKGFVRFLDEYTSVTSAHGSDFEVVGTVLLGVEDRSGDGKLKLFHMIHLCLVSVGSSGPIVLLIRHELKMELLN